MLHYSELKIGDIITLEYGKGLKNYRSGNGKYDVYGTNGKIGLSDQFLFDEPSIIIGRKGAYREVHLASRPFFVIDTAFYTKKKINDLDTLYLYFWFKNIDINEMDSGSAIPSTSREEVYDLDIKLPPLPEQKAIASVLSSLDDKIDLLHRQNKTLEAMAETLFRQWFVEEVQEGDCENGVLGDIVDINPIYQLKKGDIATYLEMSNVSNSTFNPQGWAKREFSSGMKFQNGDTLLARITPCLENGKTCFVMFLDEGEIGWGSTEYIVIRMKKPFHPFISYIISKDKDFRDFAICSMSGSSGRQRAQANVIKKYDMKIPPLATIEDLNRQLAGIVPKLEENSNQIRTLEKLRDTLLPKLMSGEVRVAYKNESGMEKRAMKGRSI